MTTTLRPGAVVALVTDSTPDSYEYGDYRGWVELDPDDGYTYVRDVAESDVRAASIEWQPSGEYARLGTVRSA